MRKLLFIMAFVMFTLMFYTGNSFAVNWTSENCVDSGDYVGTIFYTAENNTMSNGASIILQPRTDLIYPNGNPVECTEYNLSVGTPTAQNYYCGYHLSVSDYSNSNACLNGTVYNVGSGFSSSNIYCLRDWNGTGVSRVNVTLDSGGTHRLKVCHLDTYEMFISGITYFPSLPVLGNDLYVRFDNSKGSNITFLRLYNPSGYVSTQTAQWENRVVDGEILIPASKLNETGTYAFNITSCEYGDFANTSTWGNCSSCNGWFNTTSTGYDCLNAGTTYYGPPPTPVVGGRIDDIQADTWTPALGEIVNISAKVTNNGSAVQTYYFGLSVGKNYTGEWIYCNRDCYQDYDLYGDYRNVTLHPGQTVMLTRSFKFRSGWFDVNKTYDLKIGIYNAPYLDPSMALDSEIVSDAFNITTFSPNLRAEIISFNASVTKVAIDGYTTINVLIRNNGTQNYDFYLGLSVGKNDTSVFCNRYCYADCGNLSGTVICDYGRTGTIHAGQTVNVVRKFKFDSAFFDIGLYDLALGVYTAAYLGPSYATDSRMVIGYFNVTERPPCIIRSLQIYPMSDMIDQNQFVRYLFFTSYDCDGRIYWRDPGGIVRSAATTDTINGTVHEYFLPGVNVNRPGVWTYYAKSCARVEAPYMNASCETSGNRTFTVTSDVGPMNVVDPLRAGVSDALGIPWEYTLAFISMIIIIVVGAYTAYKTKYHIVPVVLMIVLFLMFTLIGWIPWWILVLIVILAAFIVAKWGIGIFGG
jgi:hypothetical protein